MLEADNGLGTLIYTVDGAGKVYSVGPQTLEVLGFELQKIINRRAAEVFRPNEASIPQVDPVTACAFLKAMQEPGKPQRCKSYLYAADGRRFNVELIVTWSERSQLWLCCAQVVSIVPAHGQISNVSKVVRMVEVNQKHVADHILPLPWPEPAVTEDKGPKFKQLALERLDELLDQVRESNERTRHLEEALHIGQDALPPTSERAKRGPYHKEYGPGLKDVLIEDGNDVYEKWKKLPLPRPTLMQYMCKQFELKDYTLRRRLREHGLRLGDLPWHMGQLASLVAAGLGAMVMLDGLDGVVDHSIHWCRLFSQFLPSLLRF